VIYKRLNRAVGRVPCDIGGWSETTGDVPFLLDDFP
jgi:hypothetical protein